MTVRGGEKALSRRKPLRGILAPTSPSSQHSRARFALEHIQGFAVPSHYYQLDSRTGSQLVQQRNPTFTDHDPIRGIGGRPLQ